MIWLILGLALWVGAHAFRRIAPARRAAIDRRMGRRAKLVFSAALVLAVGLVILGYRGAPVIPVYTPPAWGVHVVDLLMLPAIALFGLGASKSPLRARLRHPQLWGFALWSALHLLVNGDLASVVIWGTFLVWALTEMQLITAREPRPAPFEGGTTRGTIRLIAITVVLYIVITAIHAWLGVWPFPR